jgi:hypothetical protein
MFRKLLSILIVFAVIGCLGITAAADGEDAAVDADEEALVRIIADAGVKETDQFLVTITRPDGDETTFKKAYVIAGTTAESGIEVVLAMYNPETGNYEEFKNTDGDSRWEIGSFGLFSKQVRLNEGANKLKIMAYKKSEKGSLERGTNLQVNYFTVTALNESIKNKIVNSVIEFSKIFEGIFGGPNN